MTNTPDWTPYDDEIASHQKAMVGNPAGLNFGATVLLAIAKGQRQAYQRAIADRQPIHDATIALLVQAEAACGIETDDSENVETSGINLRLACDNLRTQLEAK